MRVLNKNAETGQMDVVPIKGEKLQMTPVVDGTDSPCYAALPGASQNSGGWSFKTGIIDGEKTPELQLDFEAKWVPQIGGMPSGLATSIGAIQVPIFLDKALSDPNNPFKNLWLPLAAMKDGRPVSYPSVGEIHIMARWLPPEKVYMPPGMEMIPMVSELERAMASRMGQSRLKEPIYNIEAQYLCYNPNLVRDCKEEEVPETVAQNRMRNAAELFHVAPYLECIDRRQDKAWAAFEGKYATVQGKGPPKLNLAALRDEWFRQTEASLDPDVIKEQAKNAATIGASPMEEFDNLIRGGIPSSKREEFWLSLTKTKARIESDGGDQGTASKYRQKLDEGTPQRSDGNIQLQEDAFHLACSWETSQPPNPRMLDELLARLRKAQNVCTAIISSDSGIDYCESVLVLAFFLLLPQGVKVPRFEVSYREDWMVTLRDKLFAANITNEKDRATLQVHDCRGNPLDIFKGQTPGPGQFPLSVVDETTRSMSEPTVYYMIVNLVSGTGAFRDYYGKDAVWSNNAAMLDINLLEGYLAGLDIELYQYLSSIGFHVSMVFYGCFMRLYATYMPTSTVFRFWDMLFAEAVRPQDPPSSNPLGTSRSPPSPPRHTSRNPSAGT
jgi:hypothetical protein